MNQRIINQFMYDKKNKVFCFYYEKQTRLSDAILDDIAEIDEAVGNSLKQIATVETKEDISKLRQFLADHKSVLSDSDIDVELGIEIDELARDLKFYQSKRGKKIMKIEEWIKMAKAKLEQEHPQWLIYIGRSMDYEPTDLIVGGFAPNEAERQHVIEYFNEMAPPVEITFLIQNIDEVEANLKSSPDRDKIFMELDEWGKMVAEKLKHDYPNKKFYILRSLNGLQESIFLVVEGHASDEAEKQRLIEYFNNMNPPIPIKFDISVW